MKVRADWKLEHRYFKDDIVLTNRSPFPLTNVEASFEFRQDGKVWKPLLKAERVPVGQSHRWSGVVTIDKTRPVESKMTIVCSEDR